MYGKIFNFFFAETIKKENIYYLKVFRNLKFRIVILILILRINNTRN